MLKSSFGKDITFWGGGADTRHILNSGCPATRRDGAITRLIEDIIVYT